jgi:radical SAM-linked protein
LAAVVRRAWELGAGMDAWWESLERAFAAWNQAIAEADLTWKYRQVEKGEWNVLDGGAGFAPLQDTRLDIPLPWDHLDTGIDKHWLKDDLNRALAAATVPDCSFADCSHCGVCSTDFGHNVVIQPLPIPEFAGHFVPQQHRVQRLRVWFGKQGDMALVSHLDLVRLFDRVVRRAALPIAFTGGFHPGPRISPASALPLGATSSGEIVDFELTEGIAVEVFQEKLVAQLPTDIPIYRVEAVDLQTPSATQLLEQVEYLLTLDLPEEVTSPAQWQIWIEEIKARETIRFEQRTKSGKQQQVNLRDRLYELELVKSEPAPVLRYIGSCRNDGTLLRPEHVIFMLEQITSQEFQLRHVHRNRLILSHLGS